MNTADVKLFRNTKEIFFFFISKEFYFFLLYCLQAWHAKNVQYLNQQLEIYVLYVKLNMILIKDHPL